MLIAALIVGSVALVIYGGFGRSSYSQELYVQSAALSPNPVPIGQSFTISGTIYEDNNGVVVTDYSSTPVYWWTSTTSGSMNAQSSGAYTLNIMAPSTSEQLTITVSLFTEAQIASGACSVSGVSCQNQVVTETVGSPLSVSSSALPSSGTVPLTVSFLSVVSGGNSPYTYSWTFGDGATSSNADPSHTYQSAGVYLAQLTIEDSTSDSTSSSVKVSVVASPFTTTTTTTTPQTNSSSSVSPTSGFQPPGLVNGWPASNESVYAKSIAATILLPNTIEVSNIGSSSTISYLAYGVSGSSDVLQFGFSPPSPVTLTIQTSEKPSSVWANSTQIYSWTYSNGMLTIAADPATITVFYSTPSSQPIPESEIILLLIVIIAFGAALGASLRKR